MATAGLGAPSKAAAASAADNQPVQVALDTLSPTIPTPGSTVSLGGTLRTTSPALGQLVVRLEISQVRFRDNMNDPRRGDDPDGAVTIAIGQDDVGTLAAQTPKPWQISVPANDIFSAPGVYAVDVEVVGAQNSNDPGQDLGDVWTYLPWQVSEATATPTRIAMVWPLTGTPTVDGNQDGNQQAEFKEPVAELTSDSLAHDLMPNGRLGQLLSGSRDLHVNWAVDPDLLDTVATMASGYVVRTANGGARPGSGTAAAHNWLTQAGETIGGLATTQDTATRQNDRSATATPGASSGSPTPSPEASPNGVPPGENTRVSPAVAASSTSEVWALPYADPDLDSLATAPANLQAEVSVAASYQSDAIARELGAAPQGLLALPPGGQASTGALRLAAAKLKPTAVLLSGASLPLRTPGELYTPTGLTSVDGMPAAVSDPALDAVLDGDPADNGNGAGSAPGLLAGQRYIAETALIATQVRSQRSIVVQAPRGFAPSDDLLAAMRGVGSGGWADYVGLSKVLDSSPDPNATTGTLTRSATSRSLDRSPASLDQVTRFQDDLASFASILTTPQRATTPYAPVILRALSTDWRGRTGSEGPDAYLTAASSGPEGLETQRSEVSMVPKSGITLSGRSGTLPITIVNNLAQPVRLRLVVTSGRPDLLRITPHPLLTIDPGSQQIVQVSTKASGSGVVVPVNVRLLTPAGQPYGAAQNIQVRVTNIGAIALVILLGSAGLVVLAVALRLYRATRRKRAAAAGDTRPSGDDTAPSSRRDDARDQDTATRGHESANHLGDADDTASHGSFVPPEPDDVHNGGTSGRQPRP